MTYKIFFLVLGLPLLAQGVLAERFCFGTVDSVAVGRWGGNLVLYSQSLFGSEEGRKLCALTPEASGESYKGITPTVCEIWYETLQFAMSESRMLRFDYGLDDGDSACHARGTWGVYNPPAQIRVQGYSAPPPAGDEDGND